MIYPVKIEEATSASYQTDKEYIAAYFTDKISSSLNYQTVAPSNLEGYFLTKGEQYKFEMDVDKNGEPDGDTYTWSVVTGMSRSYNASDPDVVTIDKDGIITAKNVGNVLLMAQKADGTQYYVRVTVWSVESTKPALKLSGKNTCYEGESLTLNVLAENAEMPKYSVKSSDENLATAEVGPDNTVIVTGVTGITDQRYISITVSADGYYSDTLWVNVVPKEIWIPSGNDHIFYSEDSANKIQLAVDATDQTTPSCTWSSSDESVATVDANGLVTGKNPGIAEITATATDAVYGSDSRYVYVLDENLASISYSYDGSAYTDASYLAFYFDTEDGKTINSVNFGYNDEQLMQGNTVDKLYVKVPFKASEFGFTVSWGGDSSSEKGSSKTFQNWYTTAPAAIKSTADGDNTVLEIPVIKDVASYGYFTITAAPVNTNEPELTWEFGYSFDYTGLNPEFGHNGTYTYTDGDRTFSFDKEGNFYWGVAERPVNNGEAYTDQYGFIYNSQFVQFDIENNLVTDIKANIVNSNPTLCWLNGQGEVNYYEWSFDEDASVPTFIDYYDAYDPYTLVTIDETTKKAAEAIEGLKPDATKSEVAAVVQTVRSMTMTQLRQLGSSGLDTLEAQLERVLGVQPAPSAPVNSGIADEGDRMTITPTVSGGLLLAAGITGSEGTIPTVKLETVQKPAPSNTFLSFDLDLSLNGAGVHNLAVPLTITFAFQSNFVFDEDIDYNIRHTLPNGTTEILPLAVAENGGIYFGTFETTSLSNFAVVDKNNLPGGGNGGGSSHHHSSGSGSSYAAAASATFVSDTTKDFSVNGAYQFKITSSDGTAPVLTAGTPGVFAIELVKTTGNDYFIKLTAIGKPGAGTGIYLNGVKLLVATVGTTAVTASDVKSDTNGSFNVKAGKAYTFKITANTKPTFSAATASAFKVEFVKVVGKDYFYKVTATGKAGTGSGFFVNSKRVAAATITK